MEPSPIMPQERLTLRSIPDPASPGQSVLFFQDWERACRHIADHMLTAPECEAWALVTPALLQQVNPSDGDARWRCSLGLRESNGAAAQPLYDLYCDAVARDALDASCLQWCHTQGSLTVAIGTSGVLIVIGKVVLTAFLPGQGDSQATRESQSRETGAPLARERGMRSGRSSHRDDQVRRRDAEAQVRREKDWTREQKLFYRVVRPALQFIRRSQHTQCDMLGTRSGTDYALLKPCLPPLSRLDYEQWTMLRQQCGRRDEQ